MSIPTNQHHTLSTTQDNFDARDYVTIATAVDAEAQPSSERKQSADNPFAAPTSDLASRGDGNPARRLSLDKLNRINWLLKYSQLSVLAYIGSVILMGALYGARLDPTFGELMVGISSVLCWLLITLLAYHAYHLFGSIVSAILLNFPLLNLLTMLAVHDRARKVLCDHGFNKTGFCQMYVVEPTNNQIATSDAQMAEVVPAKKERSATALVITYMAIGLLLGMLVISFLASAGVM